MIKGFMPPCLEVINLLPIFVQNLKSMPTVFILLGFVFKFYSNEHNPIHIHVLKGGAKAKYSIFPVKMIDNNGFKPSELKIIESIIEENQEVIAEHWNRYFNKDR